MNREQSDLSQAGLLEFLWKWRVPIIIITLVGAATAIVVAFTMPVYYKATAVIAPTKTNSVEFGDALNNVAEFGDDDDALRLMFILESPEIRDSLTIKYGLYDHYDIDSSEEHAHFKFQEEYEENVSFERTRENAIEIIVLDQDPEMAADMANDVVRLVDTVMNRMIRQRAIPPMHAVQDEVALILEQLGDYQDKLKALRDSGVVGEQERQDLYASYIQAEKLGNESLKAELRRKITATEKYGSDYDIYSDLSESFGVRYAEILDRNDQFRQYAETNIQQSLRRNMAEVPDKKHSPKRLIIVVVSTLAAFLFACVTVILVSRINELRRAGK